MANAFEKFQAAMNQTSPFWTKNIEVIAQRGEVVTIQCEGFTFKSDKQEEESGKK